MKYLMILLFPFCAYAGEPVLGVDSDNNQAGYGGKNALYVNDSGQIASALLAGEDQTNGVMKTEQQFGYKVCTADCQVLGEPGFVHTITCATPAGAAVAAGAVSLRDALTETTPLVATIGLANAAFTPFTLIIDAVFTTGIYLGYDGTVGAVSCTVSYR